MEYIYIVSTIALTVYGQLIIKWQAANAGHFPTDATAKVSFLLRLVLNPWVISSLIAAFLAFLCWIAALTKFELSFAYPFMSLAFVAVLALSALFLNESITGPKVVGSILIVAGIIVGSRG